MSDLYDALSLKIKTLSERVFKDGNKYYQSFISHAGKIGRKGKTKIEIEKLKWELKQKYNELGQYIAEKKILKSVTDFSHDKQFLEIVSEVNKIKIYIDELQQEQIGRDSKLASKV